MPSAKYDYQTLALLGVRFDDRQVEAIQEPEAVYAWMVPWELPDPIVLGEQEGLCEALILPNSETGEYQKIVWPRVLWPALDDQEAIAELEYELEFCPQLYGCHWSALPQVFGYEGHEQCDAFGCVHNETPSLIGFWGAYPLTARETQELEYAVMDGLHLGLWSPLVEFFGFENMHCVDVATLWEDVTDPYEPPKIPFGENLLEQYIQLADQLKVDSTKPPDHNDFNLGTADFMLTLSPHLHELWETHRVRMQRTKDQLKALFPELALYIEWSSCW